MIKNRLFPLAIGLALAFGGTSAHAAQFYFDVGENYGFPGVQADGLNTTGLFTEMLFTYDSTTYFEDTTNTGFYSEGDSSRGTGGILNEPDGGIGGNTTDTNFISGFRPGGGATSSPSRNGFDVFWFLTFGWNDLVAEVTAGGGLEYSSGTIEMYYYELDDFDNRVNFMNLEVISGGTNIIGQSLNLEAKVSFDGLAGDTEVANGVDIANFILLADGTSFFEYIQSGEELILAFIDQNTDPFYTNGEVGVSPFGQAYGEDGIVLAGQHEGSIVFAVPEPSALLLLGSGLLGLGLAVGLRRRSTKTLPEGGLSAA